MKKKVIISVLLFILVLFSYSVIATLITDNFNDGVIDGSIWAYQLQSGNLFLQEYPPAYNPATTEDIVASYRMDADSSTVYDTSPYNNHGTAQNGASYTFDGYLNGAFLFDGANDLINISDSDSLDIIDAYTLTAWIYPDTFGEGGLGRIVSKYYAGGGWAMYIRSSGTDLAFINAGTYRSSDTNSIVLDEWQHVAVTWDGTAIRFYINGVFNSSSTTANMTLPNSTYRMYIGNRYTLDRTFEGMIDEVNIWNRTLSDYEIFQEYSRTIPEEITDGYIEITGNESSGTDYVYLTTLNTIPADENGQANIEFRTVSASSNGNDRAYFGVTNKQEDDSWDSAPPTWCGVAFKKQGNQNFAFISNYPTASIIFNTQIAEDNNFHDIGIAVRREPDNNRTCYDMTFDLNTSTVCQENACQNPTLNASLSARSTTNPHVEYRFDNFGVTAFLLVGLVGDYCDTNEDCESGLCEYHFCVLKGARAECTSNAECLSGICSSGHCTQPSMWDSIEASKTQQFGDSANTNNFVSLFFMILVPAGIIAMGRHLIAIVAGIAVYFGLTIFFTVVGWLNPFFLVGSIVVALITLVFGFMLLSGGSD